MMQTMEYEFSRRHSPRSTAYSCRSWRLEARLGGAPTLVARLETARTLIGRSEQRMGDRRPCPSVQLGGSTAAKMKARRRCLHD